MKKSVIIVLIVFSTMDLFGQINKGDIIISFDGNYMNTKTENGVTTNLSSTKGQYLSIGSSFGYFFSNQFIMGIGLNYDWGKETRANKLYFNNFVQEEVMDITSNVILPNIYLGYYFPITSKLSFNTNLKLSYGVIKSDYSTLYAGAGSFITDSVINTNSNYFRGSEKQSKTDYFSTQICPELTYFISSKFSICLGLGGLEYSLIDWKKEKWIVNFNPSYWKFGIKFKI